MLWLTIALANWPDLATDIPRSTPAPGDSAVLIGIEDYAFVADVPGARANARDWYLWMTSGRGVGADRITLLEDAKATREEILDAVSRAARTSAGGGRTWVVFIGHGAPTEDGQDGLLLGADVQQTARSVAARGVTQAELLDAGSGSELVLVLDACFSGKDAGGAALVPGLQPMVPSYAAPTGEATILTAAAGDQFAGPLPGLDRPAYSYLFLAALQGWGDADGDGSVTAREANDYATRALLTTVTDRSQTPSLRGSDQVLGAQGRPPVDLVALRLGGPPPVPMPEPEPEPVVPSPPIRATKVRAQKDPKTSRFATGAWELCTVAGAGATIALADTAVAIGTGGLALVCSTGTMVAGQQTLNRVSRGQGPDGLAVGSWVGYSVTAAGGVGTGATFLTSGGDESLISLTQVLAVTGLLSSTAMTVDAFFLRGRGRGGNVRLHAVPGGLAGTF